MSSGWEMNSQPHMLLKRVFSLPDQGASAEHAAGCGAHPTALLTVALEWRAQPMASLNCRVKLQCPHLIREFSAYSYLIQIPK